MVETATIVALGKLGIEVIKKVPAFYSIISRHRLMKLVITPKSDFKYSVILNTKVANSLSTENKSNLERMGKLMTDIFESLDSKINGEESAWEDDKKFKPNWVNI